MKKRLIALDTLLLFLTLSCVAMCITLAVLKPAWVIPIVLFLALVLLWLYAGLRRFREASGRFLRAADAGTAAQSSLALSGTMMRFSTELPTVRKCACSRWRT